ncbi:MAG: hypothetical protein EOP42_12815 [Sphingobacteriaceae bacterium]|nr:MAG: hypothetical protein EOP42_12815 [Sphingobacteriaceae bacterium]
MNDNIEHTEWLNEFPALKLQSRKNPFLVPDNYFEEQEQHIRAAIFADELKFKTPQADFTVPNGYFENMQEQILSAIKLEEMRPENEFFIKPDTFFNEQQSIIAARIKISEFAEKGSGFSVPNNYFEELTDRINQKTGVKTVQQAAKVRNLFTRVAWKYATAACIAVAVTTGIFVKKYQSAHNVQTQLSNLPDADIENYLNIHADSYDNQVILETSAADNGSESVKNEMGTDSNMSIKN